MLAAAACGVPADAALAEHRRVLGHGARPADADAGDQRLGTAATGGDPGRPDASVERAERRSGWPRRAQPSQGIESAQGIQLEAVKLPTAKQRFVLLPRFWVAERSFGWMARFRRLARDYEPLATTSAGLHFVAFAIPLARRFLAFMAQVHDRLKSRLTACGYSHGHVASPHREGLSEEERPVQGAHAAHR